MHKELQQQLLAAKKDAKDIQTQYDEYREEMSDLQETMELAALDKEMAEEKVWWFLLYYISQTSRSKLNVKELDELSVVIVCACRCLFYYLQTLLMLYVLQL